MSKAILLPGLLSVQPYQNVSWSKVPAEWLNIYEIKFGVSLHRDYYSGKCFRSKIFRHIIYIYSFLKSVHEFENDCFAFSLSLLACAIHQNILDFRDSIEIFLDLEGKIKASRDKYKLCVLMTDRSKLHETYHFLNPCFVGEQCQIHHISCTDELEFINTMKKLSVDYILNAVDYPFHSKSCCLYNNPIEPKYAISNTESYCSNIYSIDGDRLNNIMNDVNQIFTAPIQFTPKLRTYDCILEVASRPQLTPLLKDFYKNLKSDVYFEALD